MLARFPPGLWVSFGLVAVAWGTGCAGAHISITRTAEGKRLTLDAKEPRCTLLITRSLVREDSKVVARLVYTGNANRAATEDALREQACKLGADALLVESERYGRDTEVLAMALVYADSPVSSESPGKAGEPEQVSGTCFAVSPDGHIITAEHVIHDAKSVQVQFEGEEPIDAAVLERRPNVDVAVLKVDRKASDFLPLEASSAFHVGDRVFTFGFPVVELLGKEPKFTDGAISALKGYEGARNLMQVTIPIQPGNSGGPIVTENGFAIGLVVSTVKAQPFFKATGALPQGLNWGVKAELAMALLQPADEAPVPVDRAGAVARARHAVCAVTAER